MRDGATAPVSRLPSERCSLVYPFRRQPASVRRTLRRWKWRGGRSRVRSTTAPPTATAAREDAAAATPAGVGGASRSAASRRVAHREPAACSTRRVHPARPRSSARRSRAARMEVASRQDAPPPRAVAPSGKANILSERPPARRGASKSATIAAAARGLTRLSSER